MKINTSRVKNLIYSFRRTTEPDSITPDSMGTLLNEIVSLLDTEFPDGSGNSGVGTGIGTGTQSPAESLSFAEINNLANSIIR